MENWELRSLKFNSIRRHRAAFTVIELMVVIAVIGILASFLLPAVLSALETSRTTRCRDNLRQLALAAQSHHAAHAKFPYTSNLFSDAKGRHPSVSPHRALLPFVDQAALFANIERDDFTPDRPFQPVRRRGPNGQLLELTVPVFLCPADSQQPGATNYRACMGFGSGIFPPRPGCLCCDRGNGTGAFVNGRSTRAADFVDGLSNTVMFSERLIGDGDDEVYTPWRDYFFVTGSVCSAEEAAAECALGPRADAQHASYSGATWLYGAWNQTWYNHIVTPNSPTPDCGGCTICVGGGPGSFAARSLHPGGVNVALADGAVRFVGNAVDLTVWRAISTRAGGEVVGSF